MLNILIPLLLGFSVYIVFRPDAIISVYIFSLLKLHPIVLCLSPEWLRIFVNNFLSDFLWAYSLTFVVSLILGYSRKNQIISFSLCFIFEAIIELLQRTKFIHGTFDIIDVFVESIAILFALVLIKKYEECTK